MTKISKEQPQYVTKGVPQAQKESNLSRCIVILCSAFETTSFCNLLCPRLYQLCNKQLKDGIIQLYKEELSIVSATQHLLQG